MRIYFVSLRKIRAGWVYALLSAIIILATVLGIILKPFGVKNAQDTMASEAKKTIIIDPGHGGEDSGAIGCSGVLEKDLNLEISMSIGAILEEKGFNVIYTRTEDRMLYLPEENIKGMRKLSDLKSRVRISEENEGSIFISIHMNSFGEAKYSGLQVYAKDKSEDSEALAEAIRRAVVSTCEPENKRAVKRGDKIYVLEKNTNTSVLIECGFLSNEAECERLSQKEFQKELSFSIVCGIIKYIEEN